MAPILKSMILLISCLFLSARPAYANKSPHLIESVACSVFKHNPVDFESCTHYLGDEPHVVAATNLFELSSALISSGISSIRRVETRIQTLIKENGKDTNQKLAIGKSKYDYSDVIESFKDAGKQLEARNLAKTSNHLELDMNKRCINLCKEGVIDYEVICGRGNKMVKIFRMSAHHVVNVLAAKYHKPPK